MGLSGREAVLVEILGPAVLQGIEDLLADCDGLVVTESLTITQTELAAKAGQVPWTWSTEYKGTNSPAGCGANSDYTVSYTVMASPPCVTVPNLAGAQPGRSSAGQGRRNAQPLGLTGHERGTSKANVDTPEVREQSPAAGFIVPPPTVIQYDVYVPEGGEHQLP